MDGYGRFRNATNLNLDRNTLLLLPHSNNGTFKFKFTIFRTVHQLKEKEDAPSHQDGMYENSIQI